MIVTPAPTRPPPDRGQDTTAGKHPADLLIGPAGAMSSAEHEREENPRFLALAAAMTALRAAPRIPQSCAASCSLNPHPAWRKAIMTILSIPAPGAVMRRLAGAIVTGRRRAAERRMLAELDERLLHDIGLTRCDIKEEVNKPFWRR